MISLLMKRQLQLLHLLGTLFDCICCSDSHVNCVGCLIRAICLLDSMTLELTGLLRGHTQEVRFLHFDRTSRFRLVSGGKEGCIRLWNTAKYECVRTSDLLFEVWCCKFSPDGSFIGVIGEAPQVYLLDSESLYPILKLDVPGDYEGRVVTFSPKGRLMATGHIDHVTRIWKLPLIGSTLQSICRMVITDALDKESDVDKLPLPRELKRFLKYQRRF